MSIKEKIEALKQLFSQPTPPMPTPVPEPTPAPAPVEFKDYTAADGVTVLSIDKLEVGGKVMIAGAPAADGEYTLADGKKMKVMGGLITEMEAPAPAPPAPVDMSNPQAMQALFQEFAEAGTPDIKKLAMIVQALFEDRFGWDLRRQEEEAKRTQAIEAYKQGFEAQIKAQAETIGKLIEVFEEFAAIEKGEPAPVKPQSFRKDADAKDKRRQEIAEAFKELAKSKTAAN